MTQIANGLASLGVRRPDAVTLCGPNTSMLFAATLAAQAAGIAAPLNPALKVAAHTHASQLACGRGIALCSGLAPGRRCWAGCRCSTSTP